MSQIQQLLKVSQEWKEPSAGARLPIAIIGGGGIMQQAHIPSYIQHSFPIAAVCDLNTDQLQKCQQLLKGYRAPNYHKPVQYFTSIQDLLSFIKSNQLQVVFDIATRPLAYIPIFTALPPKSVILLQKPFGHNLKSTKQLVQIIHKKQFIFAANFQGRFSSLLLFINNVLETPKYRHLFGDLIDVEFNLKHVIPWHNWPWLKAYEDTEPTFHSVHYLDALQAIFGVPHKVFADINDPQQMTVIMNYASTNPKYPNLKIRLHIDHSCKYQIPQSHLNINGSKGAMLGTLGSFLNELAGAQNMAKDTMTVVTDRNRNLNVELKNPWFIGAFYGPMANLQRFVIGEDKVLRTNVHSAYNTSLLVHALKLSQQEGRVIDMKDIHRKHAISSLMRSQL